MTAPIYYVDKEAEIKVNGSSVTFVGAGAAGLEDGLSAFYSGAKGTGAVTLKFLAKGNVFSTLVTSGVEILIGDGQVTVAGQGFDAAATAAITAAILAPFAISSLPVVAAVGISATTGAVVSTVYSTFFEGAVDGIIDQLSGTVDIDIQLKDSDGNIIGGALFEDGFPSRIESELHGAATVLRDGSQNGLPYTITDGMEVEVITGSNTSGNVYTAFSDHILLDMANMLGLTTRFYEQAIMNNYSTGVIHLEDENFLVAGSAGGFNFEGEFYNIENILTGDTVLIGDYGSNDKNLIIGTNGDDALLSGNGGNDLIYGGYGEDNLSGGEGSDTLYGGGDVDALDGGDGDDTLYGGGDGDTLGGGSDNDTLYGDSGNDTLYGHSGQDRLIGGVGDDNLDGGTNLSGAGDIADYSEVDGAKKGALHVTKSSQTDYDWQVTKGSETDQLVNIEIVKATNQYENTITLNGQDVEIDFSNTSTMLTVDGDDIGAPLSLIGFKTVNLNSASHTIERSGSVGVEIMTPGIDTHNVVDYSSMTSSGYGIAVYGVGSEYHVYQWDGEYLLSKEHDVLSNIDHIIGTGNDDAFFVTDLKVSGGQGDDTYSPYADAANIDEKSGEGNDSIYAYNFLPSNTTGTDEGAYVSVVHQSYLYDELQFNNVDNIEGIRYSNSYDPIAIEEYIDDGQGGGSPSGFTPPLPPIPMPSPSDILLPDNFNDFQDDWEDAEKNNSPLVLDLDGDGIELSSLDGNGSVYWDIDVDGFLEASGWIAGGDGLLTIDLNGDGVINDHSELFGTDTTDGFTILSAYDSNLDNVIDSNDTQFNDLLVWVDSNANGYSEGDELHSLTDLGITNINLNASLVDYDIAGNQITHESTFTINGQTQTVVDAWFAYDNANSQFLPGYSDSSVLHLPELRGYGDVKDLRVAMSIDSVLRDLVEEIASVDKSEILDPSFDLTGKMEEIMFRWAGVDGVDPASRGAVNAQKLEFLENYFGDDYVNPFSGSTTPQAGGVNDVHNLFDDVLANLTASIIAQTDASFYLGEDAFYNAVSGEIENVETPDSIFFLKNNEQAAQTDGNDVYVFANGAGNVSVYEPSSDTGYDQIWVDFASTEVSNWVDLGGELHFRIDGNASDMLSVYADSNWTNGVDIVNDIARITFADGVVWNLNEGLIQNDTDDAHTLWGSVHSDQIDGRGGVDNINGFAGDDVLIGGSGNDEILGGDGNDTITGGADNDTLRGNQGDDQYIWSVGDGNDVVIEDGGIDQLVLHGVSESDIRFEKYNTYSLKLHIGSESIEIRNQFLSDYQGNNFSDYYHVESLLLDGGTVIDLLNDLPFEGTSGTDYLYGTNASDSLYGLEGNDTLTGNAGDDTLVGGLGNDTLKGGAGDDTYIWSIGDGNETLMETSGVDKIVFGAGITEDDLSFSLYSSYDVKIHIGSEEITLSGHRLNGKAIETAVLEDGTVIDLVNDLTYSGTENVDHLFGTSGAETLKGLGGNDYIYGSEGDDTLYGGHGADYLFGQGGADTFVFEADSAFLQQDSIQDFSLAQGDKLDISDLISGYDPLTDAISDFVQITDSGSSSVVSVDADGGADNFVQIATLNNVVGLTDEEALETSGNLIVV